MRTTLLISWFNFDTLNFIVALIVVIKILITEARKSSRVNWNFNVDVTMTTRTTSNNQNKFRNEENLTKSQNDDHVVDPKQLNNHFNKLEI